VSFLRIDDNVPHHRKILQAGPHASWLWLCGIAYCQRMKSDGFIPIEAMPMIGVANWKKYAGICITSGLMHKVEGGYEIHDYLDHNASADEREERAQDNKDRQRRWREAKQQARNALQDATVTHNQRVDATLLLSSPLLSSPTTTRQQPRFAGQTHAGHVFGFCEFKCLSEQKIREFSQDLPGGATEPNFTAALKWAEGVRDGWGERPKLESKWFEFWEARWKERKAALMDRPVSSAAFDAINQRLAAMGGVKK
jgi:hypothetical protein